MEKWVEMSRKKEKKRNKGGDLALGALEVDFGDECLRERGLKCRGSVDDQEVDL